MIWHGVINGFFDFLNFVFSGFGLFDFHPFYQLTSFVSELFYYLTESIGIISPFVKVVLFFLPINGNVLFFMGSLIVIILIIRILISILKLILEVIPF